MFKIATWNVNSLRVRLPHVQQWLDTHQPDVLALQETKMPDDVFPFDEIKALGYEVVASGQRTYNGVAMLSRQPITEVITDIPELHDPQRRVLCVTIGDVRVLDIYIPNGESVESEKYQYKLNWLRHLDVFLQAELKKYPKMIVLGDFNIAPQEIDVHDPKQWDGHVLFSPLERQAFQAMLGVGFVDCYRQLLPAEKQYSWWDYRMNAFKRNIGLRIDHILASHALAPRCIRCSIDKAPRSWERPSDHAPVMAEFDIG
jgi:exodeoxyribonuclease-3